MTPPESLDPLELRREGLLGLALHSGPVNHEYLQTVAFEMQCRDLLSRLDKSGLPWLVFKGCSLALRTYGRPGTRAFSDVDVAIPQELRRQAEDSLIELGFTRAAPGVWQVQNLTLDLHDHPLHQLAPLLGAKAGRWWEFCQPFGEEFRHLRVLDASHEFVLGLMHAAKHSFCRAGWLVDLLLLRRGNSEVLETVERYRAGRLLAYADWLCRLWFGLELGGKSVGWWPWERKFLDRVVERSAPESWGMLAVLSCATNPLAAAHYLRRTLYPAGVSFGERTRRLLGMAAG